MSRKQAIREGLFPAIAHSDGDISEASMIMVTVATESRDLVTFKQK